MTSAEFSYPAFSVSVSCMDLLCLENQIKECESAGISFFHYDVVDGNFNQCFVLGDTLLEQMSQITSIPIEVHLAIYRPERFIKLFADAGADYIAVQYEAMEDPLTIFNQIEACGSKPVLCYRAETAPSDDFVELASRVEWILKLTVNPGFSGQVIQPQAIQHISMMSDMLRKHRIDTPIQADGNVNISTIGKLAQAGASIFTGGTSGLFDGNSSIEENITILKNGYDHALNEKI